MSALVQESGKEARITFDDLLQPLKKGGFSAKNEENTVKTNEMEWVTALSKRMVRQMVDRIKPRAGQIGARHVESVLELARSGRSGGSLSLPGGVEIHRERNALVFRAIDNAGIRSTSAEPKEFSYDIDLASGTAGVRVEELGCVFRFREIDWPRKRGETSNDGGVLDRERLRFPLVLRNWCPGDRFRPQGHQSVHKLKRLLNEKRISRWDRDGWPVLTSGGILVWARGFAVAAEFAANEGTRTGILIVEEKI